MIMKRSLKVMSGVTLLEIMLVLAIAAMIIVMSIRYYQSATASQQANSVMEQLQAITAAADSIGNSAGGYSTITANSVISPLLPANGLITTWGGAITVSGGAATTYAVSIANTPVSVCNIIKSKLGANAQYTGAAANTCATVGAFSYTYDSTKT